MSRSLTIFFLLTLVSYEGSGQTTDVIDKLNEHSFQLRSSQRDSSRILAYEALAYSSSLKYLKGTAQAQLNLGIHYCNLDVLDSASFYLNTSYQYWLEQPNTFNLALNYWYFGKLYQKIGDFDKAFYFLNKAEEQFRRQDNKLFQLYVVTEEGVYHEMQSEYPKALDYYLQAYKLIETMGDTKNSIVERSNIASIYARMGRFEEAKKYAKLSVETAQKQPDAEGRLAVEYRKLGKIFQMEESYDSAIFYYDRALAIAAGTKTSALQSGVLSSLASLYNELGALQRANAYLLEAIELANGFTLLDIYLELSRNYLAQQQIDSSLYYASSCIALANTRESKQHLLEANTIKMEVFAELQYYDSAFWYAKQVKIYSDLIYNQKKDRQFNNLRVQLGLVEKEKEIQELMLVQYQNKVRTTRIIIGVSSVVIILTVTLIFFRTKHKKKQRLLELQLAKSKKKLSAQTLSMIHRNNAFEEIELELIDVRSRCNGNADPGLQKIQNAINLNKSLESDWDNFSNYFSEIHSSFFNYFTNQSFGLSDYELRLCALMKLRLTNKEIATILNIEHNSVKMAKYRLKKKLKVGEEQTLDEFILQVG